jgi:hypothetical protein
MLAGPLPGFQLTVVLPAWVKSARAVTTIFLGFAVDAGGRAGGFFGGGAGAGAPLAGTGAGLGFFFFGGGTR